MKVIKILNLYAGIGGNRKNWPDTMVIGGEVYKLEITAVELDPEIAGIYQKHFPNDRVIVGDAHAYLLANFREYDYIWSSFPCITHSRMNVNFNRPRFPDLRLYEEILFLQTYYKGKFTVENVIPCYEPLIPAQQVHRHLFWCNFKIKITGKENPPKQIQSIVSQHTRKKRPTGGTYNNGDIMTLKKSQPRYGFDLSAISLKTRKDKILRNLVDPEIGLMILECAMGLITQSKTDQLKIAI